MISPVSSIPFSSQDIDLMAVKSRKERIIVAELYNFSLYGMLIKKLTSSVGLFQFSVEKQYRDNALTPKSVA